MVTKEICRLWFPFIGRAGFSPGPWLQNRYNIPLFLTFEVRKRCNDQTLGRSERTRRVKWDLVEALKRGSWPQALAEVLPWMSAARSLAERRAQASLEGPSRVSLHEILGNRLWLPLDKTGESRKVGWTWSTPQGRLAQYSSCSHDWFCQKYYQGQLHGGTCLHTTKNSDMRQIILVMKVAELHEEMYI